MDKSPVLEKDTVAEHLRGMSGYNKSGEEIPDPRPVELPVGFRHPKSIQDTMRDLMRNELFNREMAARGMDTFDEADDFEPDDVDDLADRNTPYEKEFDPHHVATREQEIRSGFVEEIPVERKEKAKQVIDAHKKRIEESQRPKKKKAKPVADEEIDAEEEE